MDDAVRKYLEKLLVAIAQFPGLHTKSIRLGACVYDVFTLIEDKTYYIRISFEVMPNGSVVFHDKQCVESPGPH